MRRHLRTWLSRVLFAFAGVVALLIAGAPSAGAHTGFESSDPADGAIVDADLDTITVTFTNEAEATGEGFVVLDPRLGLREPTEVGTPDIGVFVLRFDPAISHGEVGVRWNVKAPDAHPINGAFVFTVAAPIAAPADPTPTPAPAPAQDSARAGDDQTLEEFLSEESTSESGRTIANLGRFLSMGGMMIALGFLVFALTVMRGTRPELRMLLFWIRRAGLVVVFGTILDAAGQIVFETGQGVGALTDLGSYADVLWSSLGIALFLRLLGGVIVTSGARISMVHAHEARDYVASVSARVPIGAGSTRVADHRPDSSGSQDVAWDVDRHGALALSGFILMLASHTFDGHTVTEGVRLVTGLVSALHVLAAAVWAGGVAALALLIRRRSRRGEPTHSLVLVTRYSVVATIALAAVAILGIYLAFVILDAPSELWTTDWGRLFLAKTAIVGVAAAMGAHNHHIIVPALEASEEDDATVARLRSALRNEVITLSVVTAITALLVRAASTL